MAPNIPNEEYVSLQVRSALFLVGNISVVLDEDGTSVETEEFFHTLDEGTVLVVLTKGQIWRPAKVSGGVQLSSMKV